MTRLRSFHLRASRYGGQAAATARQARLRLRLRRGGLRLCLATALFVLIAGSTRALACPVCFGAEETSMVDGAKLGVLVMLGVTLAVQGGFLGFFLYLRRRAKRIADLELDSEWSELQSGPRTS